MLSSTNAADCVVNCDMEIESSGYGLHTREGVFTVPSEVTINITTTSVDNIAYGCFTERNSAFMLEGSLIINNTGDKANYVYALYTYNNSTFTAAPGAIINITNSNTGAFTDSIYNSSNSTMTLSKGATLNATSSSSGTRLIGIHNDRSTFTVDGDIVLSCICNNETFAIYSYNSNFIINGMLDVIMPNGTLLYSTNVLEGTGTITVNGEPYNF